MGCGAYHTVALAGYPLENIDIVRKTILLSTLIILLRII